MPRKTASQFIRLYHQMMYYAGQQRAALLDTMTLEEFINEPLEVKVKCRDHIYEPEPLFGDFLKDRENELAPEDREMIAGWQQLHVKDQFVALRHWDKYLIVLPGNDPEHAYGVYGLTSDLKKIFPPRALPFFVQTAVLSCGGVMVVDGLFSGFSIFIGSNMQHELEDQFEEIRAAGGLITAPPWEHETPGPG